MYGQAKTEENELKNRLSATMKARQTAEGETNEAMTHLSAAQAKEAATSAENAALRKDLSDWRRKAEEAEVKASKGAEGGAGEQALGELRRDFNATKAALADSEQVGTGARVLGSGSLVTAAFWF